MSEDEKPGDDARPDTISVEIKSIEQALGFLFMGLQEANRLFVEREDSGRLGSIEALNAVVQFLRCFKDADLRCQPLTALLNALVSPNDGQVSALLQPHRRKGRPFASPARENYKALAAVTVFRLRETGLDEKKAYEKVAQVCREEGVKPARKGKDSPGRESETTGRTVRGWMTAITADVGRRSPAAQAFDRQMKSAVFTPQAINQAIQDRGLEAVQNALLEVLRLSFRGLRAAES
jgi:hypothetical protein